MKRTTLLLGKYCGILCKWNVKRCFRYKAKEKSGTHGESSSSQCAHEVDYEGVDLFFRDNGGTVC